MARSHKKLGEYLVEWGAIQPKEVEKALAHAKTKNLRIGEAVIDRFGKAMEPHVYKALAANMRPLLSGSPPGNPPRGSRT